MHCLVQPFAVSQLWVSLNGIDFNPEYQRESAVWSIEKQQLFIDSILNRFDVPKIYFHDLRMDSGSPYEFAVVDGKQRLLAIIEFMKGTFPLAPDFSLMEARKGQAAPPPNTYYSDLKIYWQEELRGASLSVVVVQNATEEDIEELFSRLNNGEPLNAAEKRNAMGGDLCKLIREVAKDDFFKNHLKVANKRYQHYEIAVKLIHLERTHQNGAGTVADLKKRFLDALVTNNKSMTTADIAGLKKRVVDRLKTVCKVFKNKDPLLSKQAYPPLYYILIKKITKEYADPQLHSKIRGFLESFTVMRSENLNQPEDDRDPNLIEFGRLMQQGTNDLGSLKDRVSILTRYFLLENPDVRLRDAKRLFTDEERLAIWILGGKVCASCSDEIELDDMHADHKVQWAHGGETSLKNGRCLCVSCNSGGNQKIS